MMNASRAFRQKDKDHTGSLDHHELKKALQELGYPAREQEMYQLVRLIDRDGSGNVSEREFCEYWGFHGW